VKTAQDVLNHLEAATAKIKIKFFTASPNILGSTSGNTISFNVNNFATRPDKEVANTLFHESLHTMGYGHCGKNNIRLFPKIKRSIPYKLGNFVEELY
jgi:ssRNA-specific RNase YbeY (16S rRNA maturation enzyme)